MQALEAAWKLSRLKCSQEGGDSRVVIPHGRRQRGGGRALPPVTGRLLHRALATRRGPLGTSGGTVPLWRPQRGTRPVTQASLLCRPRQVDCLPGLAGWASLEPS